MDLHFIVKVNILEVRALNVGDVQGVHLPTFSARSGWFLARSVYNGLQIPVYAVGF